MTTRHSTSRSWSTRGGQRKGKRPWAPCGQSTWLSSGSRRGRGRPDPVWTMTSLPRTTCRVGSDHRGGLLRSAPWATSGAPRSKAGTEMERKDQKGVDRDPAPGACALLVPPAPSCSCRWCLHPLCCVAGEAARPAGRV